LVEEVNLGLSKKGTLNSSDSIETKLKDFLAIETNESRDARVLRQIIIPDDKDDSRTCHI